MSNRHKPLRNAPPDAATPNGRAERPPAAVKVNRRQARIAAARRGWRNRVLIGAAAVALIAATLVVAVTASTTEVIPGSRAQQDSTSLDLVRKGESLSWHTRAIPRW